MTIITVPTKFSFTSVSKFTLQRASNVIRSQYSGARQVISYPYAVWLLEATLVDYDSTEARLIRSFLVQLEGEKNTFRIPVPGYSAPTTGYVAGNCLANGIAAARASSMAVDGLSNSTAILNEGDYFSVGDELKVCTASVSSNGSGQIAVLSFKPPLRRAVADNQAVTLQAPTILMHAADDDVAGWGLTPPNRHNIKFKATEAIEL